LMTVLISIIFHLLLRLILLMWHLLFGTSDLAKITSEEVYFSRGIDEWERGEWGGEGGRGEKSNASKKKYQEWGHTTTAVRTEEVLGRSRRRNWRGEGKRCEQIVS
jgi:hypothetical protein